MAKRYGILTLKCNGCYFVDEKSGTLDAEIKWQPREVDEICLDCKGKKRRATSVTVVLSWKQTPPEELSQNILGQKLFMGGFF